jgi:E3 ubiquitin-protein ligase HUWE1
VRLLAFHIMFQCNPSSQTLADFYAKEPEFVTDLVGLLMAGAAVPEDLRTQALRVLAVQLLDRTHHLAVISAISSGGQSGLLSMLMHRAIASLAGGASAAAAEQYSLGFAEALLSLVGALSSSSSGCNALSEAGVIPALLPLLKDSDPAHLMVVGTAVRILEAFMDFQPHSATLFREIGGLRDMIGRLKAEVEAPPKESAAPEAMQTDVEPAVATSAQELSASTSPAAAPAGAAARPIPYARRVLLKSLLRAIALSSYAPGTTGRPQV